VNQVFYYHIVSSDIWSEMMSSF